MDVKKGEILGFVGPNGAGKSTTMKMLAQTITPTSGEIWVQINDSLQQVNKARIDLLVTQLGFLLEVPEFYPDLTPRQHLTYFAKLGAFPARQVRTRVEEVVDMVGMSEWIDKKIKTFSKGMRQKIGIAAALVHDPEIVVLDEPQTGLDPGARLEIHDLLLKLKADGKTIFLSSHLLYEVSELCDRVAIINHGMLVAVDSIENLEAKIKHSRILVKLLHHRGSGEIEKILMECRTLIGSLRNLEDPNEQNVQYNPSTNELEIEFNGSPQEQYNIIKILVECGIEFSEFKASKVTALEEIYLKLIQTDDKLIETT
ncbi:MAG: trehalose/maltose import ATP-binding protein MalK [Promethearchaeota archaeon CR_4]|nr:MAG: trehalose/maltose import ATP-binding protein MalK [Candidatus Lokiarchaeota archaeon CR_4]